MIDNMTFSSNFNGFSIFFANIRPNWAIYVRNVKIFEIIPSSVDIETCSSIDIDTGKLYSLDTGSSTEVVCHVTHECIR